VEAHLKKERLRELRETLKLSQEEFAKKVGLTRNTIARQEQGRMPIQTRHRLFYAVMEYVGNPILRILDRELEEIARESRPKPRVRLRFKRRRRKKY
jgi:transcriptional regulator with XRE-family HTH domain